ncbi:MULTISPECIES: hypothetical protein [Pseudomonas]|uniref:hypothetical protein n=1 Tax=Pseudomonas TaxID=286 RepID=UPI00236158B8|nr:MULTISPECIES: hypothetical protein [Pseudomonas]WJV23177.1 hypothetical protein PSR66_26655 [Pseudomonas chlororaphis]
MINELHSSKSCCFFKQNAPITGKAISELFQAMKLGQPNPSNDHFSASATATMNSAGQRCIFVRLQSASLPDSQ